MQSDPQKLKFFAAGANAKGIIAVGSLAQGIVAIGVNAVGVVAIGLNAMGTAVALGLNAVAPVALSAVNSLALLGWSAVNVFGGFGAGLVNDLVHPIFGGLLVVVMVVIGFKLGGRWQPAKRPAFVSLSALQSGGREGGWTQVRLLDIGNRTLVVGDSDCHAELVASTRAVADAHELSAFYRRRVMVDVEVTYEADGEEVTDYRSAVDRTAVLYAKSVCRIPRRPPWPQRPDELRYVLGRSLWVSAVLGSVALSWLTFF